MVLASELAVVGGLEVPLQSLESHAHQRIPPDQVGRELALIAPGVVILDLEGPHSLKVLAEIQGTCPGVPVVLLTTEESLPTALEGVRRGAFQYLRRPFLPEELSLVLERARAVTRRATRHPFADQGLIGRSACMRRVFDLVEQVARADTTVLIQGESGTGKELVARAIHDRSHRRQGPFVAVNCGAIPKDLIESELFGHSQGAFSGATNHKRGLVEEGDGGTVFLDEVSEIAASLQVKLTRVLQEREIRRVGDTASRQVDVRFLAATNRELDREVEEGRFREDLFFRLQVYPIDLPPLRQRTEDISDLVAHYLAEFAHRLGKPIKGVDRAAMAALEAYAWPGNVRELVNMVERAVLLEKGTSLSMESFPGIQRERSRSGFWEPPVEYMSYKEYMEGVTDRAQHRYFTKIMERFTGNVALAAEHTGLKRETIYRILKRLDLRPADFREGA